MSYKIPAIYCSKTGYMNLFLLIKELLGNKGFLISMVAMLEGITPTCGAELLHHASGMSASKRIHYQERLVKDTETHF